MNVRSPARASAPGLAVAAALVLGLALLRTGAGCRDTDPGQPIEQATEQAALRAGESLTLRGEAGRIFGDRAFELERTERFDGDVLVVTRDPIALGNGGLESGQDLLVSGTARPLIVSDLERELGWDLEPEIELEFRTRPVIVARAIALHQQPALAWSAGPRVPAARSPARAEPVAPAGPPADVELEPVGAAEAGTEAETETEAERDEAAAPETETGPSAQDGERADRPRSPRADRRARADRRPGETGTRSWEVEPLAARHASAVADLDPARGASGVDGTAAFVRTPEGLRVAVRLKNATPGWHRVQVRPDGDCAGAPARGSDGAPAGADGSAEPTVRELGRLLVAPDGKGHLAQFLFEPLEPDLPAIIGGAVVVSAGAETGAEGEPTACGVVYEGDGSGLVPPRARD